MQEPEKLNLNKVYLFRLTHIQNIPRILESGITHRQSARAHTDYVPLGDPGLIFHRSRFRLANGQLLGDYIPFYFGPRMPMLYVIQHGLNGLPQTPAAEIVYCISSVRRVLDLGLPFAYTDGHANSRLSRCYGPEDIQELHTQLDMKAVRAPHWNRKQDQDLKRRKEAEFLLAADLPPAGILGYVVRDEAACARLRGWGVEEGLVISREKYYF